MLTFFETIKLPFKPSLNDSISFRNGKKFRCVGFGKAVIENEYQDFYTYREFNTENAPTEFVITPEKYCDAMLNKKIVKA